ESLVARTVSQNPVFRFKIDFVRRRVLPVLKKLVIPADLTKLESDIRILRSIAAADVDDPELATSTAGSMLIDAERAFGDKGTEEERERFDSFVHRLREAMGASGELKDARQVVAVWSE